MKTDFGCAKNNNLSQCIKFPLRKSNYNWFSILFPISCKLTLFSTVFLDGYKVGQVWKWDYLLNVFLSLSFFLLFDYAQLLSLTNWNSISEFQMNAHTKHRAQQLSRSWQIFIYTVFFFLFSFTPSISISRSHVHFVNVSRSTVCRL